MANPMSQYFYLLEEDLYRVGNTISPRLDHVRNTDVDVYQRNGIMMVRANGRGVSIGTLEYLQKLQFQGWLWKIPATASLAAGLLLRADPDPGKQGHYFLCPDSDMSIDKFRALLSELALRCERIEKL